MKQTSKKFKDYLFRILAKINFRVIDFIDDKTYHEFVDTDNTPLWKALIHERRLPLRYAVRLAGDKDFFSFVEVETITACNRRCSYCPNSKYDRSLIKNNKEMDKKLFYRIIDQLTELKFNGRFSPHFYNEPLLDKRLPNLLKYVRQKLPYIKITLYTNGDLLNIKLYKKLIQSGVNCFFITPHSSKQSQDIKKIFDYRKKHGTDDVEIVYKKLDVIYNRGGIIKVKKIRKKKYCSLPSKTIVIDYKGNVILCCNDYSGSVKFGNIKNEKLKDIINKSNYKRVRKELREGKFKFPVCKKCRWGY